MQWLLRQKWPASILCTLQLTHAHQSRMAVVESRSLCHCRIGHGASTQRQTRQVWLRIARMAAAGSTMSHAEHQSHNTTPSLCRHIAHHMFSWCTASVHIRSSILRAHSTSKNACNESSMLRIVFVSASTWPIDQHSILGCILVPIR